MLRIDSHQHFWKYDPAEYGWISDPMSALRRDFLPADLGNGDQHSSAIDGVVTVQARQTLEETAGCSIWPIITISSKVLSAGCRWPRRMFARIWKDLPSGRKLKGVRHVVQDEPDDQFILRDDFNAGIRALADYGLVYDILIFERHLPQAIEFVDRHPNQRFVLDHLAKPRAKEHQREPWRTNIHRLAERENVFCKLSGLVTEADWTDWTDEQLSVYLETVLDAFGPQRVMFGSDWPVCLLATTYARWYDVVARFCEKLSADEQDRIFGGTAVEAYGL